MPVFYANSDYNRSWNRCLYARFPNAVIKKIERLPGHWIKVEYKNDDRYWKGKLKSHSKMGK